MANGGAVSPDLITPSVSGLLDTLSDYTLPSEVESTASGILETETPEPLPVSIDFTSLTDSILESSGLGLGFRQTIPYESLPTLPQNEESFLKDLEATQPTIVDHPSDWQI